MVKSLEIVLRFVLLSAVITFISATEADSNRRQKENVKRQEGLAARKTDGGETTPW